MIKQIEFIQNKKQKSHLIKFNQLQIVNQYKSIKKDKKIQIFPYKKKKMNLNPKYILPKSQMTINSLLADREKQNHQLNFSHEDFSIQIKYNHLLSINFFEPDLQDVQWNVEFMGVKNLKHVSVSQYKRRRVRLLYAKNNTLYFYEGHLASRQNKYTLRQSMLQSEKIITLTGLKNNDQVLFISQDMTQNEKAGLFLICTVKNHFYILKGNSEIHQLIDLNPLGGIEKILSSITKIFIPKNSQYLPKIQQQTVSYLSLKKQQQKQQYFRVIVLRDFLAQIRIINLPIIPGQKCQRQIILTKQISFQVKIREVLQLSPLDTVNILSSQIYRLNEYQAIIFFVLQKVNTQDSHVVSLVYNFQINEIISANMMLTFSHKAKNIELRKDPQTNDIVIKLQQDNRVILKYVQLETLREIYTKSCDIEGPSMLCESIIGQRLILLSPYQVLDINFRQPALNEGSQMQEQQFGNMRQQRMENTGSISQLHKNLINSHKKLQIFYNQHRMSQVRKIFDNLQSQIDLILRQILSANNRQNIAIEQIISIYLTLLMYRLLLEQQSNFSKINKKKVEFNFNDLTKRNFKQITQFMQMIQSQNDLFGEFIQLWINVFQEFKAKQWFENEQIRKIFYALINGYFGEIINSVFEKYLCKLFEKQDKNIIQQPMFLPQIIDNLLIKFIRSTSGIIRIEKQNIRRMIIKSNKKQEMKNITLQIINIDLLELFYFQQGIISIEQLEGSFNSISNNNQTVVERFIETFLLSFIDRVKNSEKINQNAKNFNNLLSVFTGRQEIVKKVIKQSGSYLHVLTDLKYGQRQKVKKDIKKIMQKMKKKQNQKKLRLIVVDQNQMREQFGQRMDEE